MTIRNIFKTPFNYNKLFTEKGNVVTTISKTKMPYVRDFSILNCTGRDIYVQDFEVNEVVKYPDSGYTIYLKMSIEPRYITKKDRVPIMAMGNSYSNEVVVNATGKKISLVDLPKYDKYLVTPDVLTVSKNPAYATYFHDTGEKVGKNEVYAAIFAGEAYCPVIAEVTDEGIIIARDIHAPYEAIKRLNYTDRTAHRISQSLRKLESLLARKGMYIHTLVMADDLAKEFNMTPDVRGEFNGLIMPPRYIREALKEDKVL